jgi:hypothetical protein
MLRSQFVSLAPVFALLVCAGCGAGSTSQGASPAEPGDASASAAPLDRDQRTLLDGTRQIAAKLLRELGAFPPVALALDPSGKTLLVTLSDVDPQTVESKKIELLAQKLKVLAGKKAIRAVGIIVNGEIAGDDGKRRDAVIVSIEERGVDPRGFSVAYRLSGKRVAFAEPTALRARSVVFGAPSSDERKSGDPSE